MKKSYTIQLDKEIVDKTKIKIEKYGGKLSTFINNQLKEFTR